MLHFMRESFSDSRSPGSRSSLPCFFCAIKRAPDDQNSQLKMRKQWCAASFQPPDCSLPEWMRGEDPNTHHARCSTPARQSCLAVQLPLAATSPLLSSMQRFLKSNVSFYAYPSNGLHKHTNFRYFSSFNSLKSQTSLRLIPFIDRNSFLKHGLNSSHKRYKYAPLRG